MSGTSPIVELQDVVVEYGDGERGIAALRGVSLTIAPGEFVAITGPSGSGKTTLLNVLAGLQVPTSGRVMVDGKNIAALSDGELARIRRQVVAYVFQFFNLLPTLTARQNVAVPLRADGFARREIEQRVVGALESVGLAHRADHFPHELSGGEMQRVAVARVLAAEARVVLADEPTGNLDSLRSEEVLELLKRATEEKGRSVLLVTHNVRAAAYGDRILTLRDGKIVDEVAGMPKQAEVLPLRRR